jgi:hypothetical protein
MIGCIGEWEGLSKKKSIGQPEHSERLARTKSKAIQRHN